MSFYLPATKIEQSTEMNVALQESFTAEGQAVVRQAGATANGVLPSTGQATDIFCGFSFAGTSAAPFPETKYNKVETFLVPATGKVTLSLTPDASAVSVFDQTTNAFVPATGTGAFTVTGNTVGGLTPGDTVVVTYKYTLSAIQRRTLYGDVQPGGYSGTYISQIGVVTRGTIFTTEFDAAANWALAGQDAAHTIVLAANGQITLGTPGAAGAAPIAVPQAYVLAVPGADIPFLGIVFDAI